MTTRDERKVKGGVERRAASTAALAAIGLEAEFTMLLDGEQAKPEDVFGSPRKLVRGPMMHRTVAPIICRPAARCTSTRE